MGKTVPSCPIALELEIAGWKGFGIALNSEGQEAFSELMDACRNFATASGSACNPIIFENMTIAILLAQQKRLQKLDYKLKELSCERCPQNTEATFPPTENVRSNEWKNHKVEVLRIRI